MYNETHFHMKKTEDFTRSGRLADIQPDLIFYFTKFEQFPPL